MLKLGFREFLGGSVIRTPCFPTAEGVFSPSWGTRDSLNLSVQSNPSPPNPVPKNRASIWGQQTFSIKSQISKYYELFRILSHVLIWFFDQSFKIL